MPKSLGIACGCVVLSHFHSLTLYVRFVVLFRRRVRYIQFVVVCCVLVLCSNSSTAQMIKQTHPHRHKRIHVNNLNDFVFAIESLDLLWHLEMSQWLLWLCRFDFSEGMLFVFPQSGTSLYLSLSLFLFSLLSYSSLSPFLSLPLSPPPLAPRLFLSRQHTFSPTFSPTFARSLFISLALIQAICFASPTAKSIKINHEIAMTETICWYFVKWATSYRSLRNRPFSRFPPLQINAMSFYSSS